MLKATQSANQVSWMNWRKNMMCSKNKYSRTKANKFNRQKTLVMKFWHKSTQFTNNWRFKYRVHLKLQKPSNANPQNNKNSRIICFKTSIKLRGSSRNGLLSMIKWSFKIKVLRKRLKLVLKFQVARNHSN